MNLSRQKYRGGWFCKTQLGLIQKESILIFTKGKLELNLHLPCVPRRP